MLPPGLRVYVYVCGREFGYMVIFIRIHIYIYIHMIYVYGAYEWDGKAKGTENGNLGFIVKSRL